MGNHGVGLYGGEFMLAVNIKKGLPDFTVDIHFTVSNEVLVLFGPSGCGKTTILRMIAGLEKPDEGEITLEDERLFDKRNKISVRPQNRKCGFVFQDCALFPHLNVTRNILYGVPRPIPERELRFKRLLKTLGIGHLVDRFPAELSGGEKQRIALARALMIEPAMLLLDEPFSALDWDTRAVLGDELVATQRRRGIPFILVTHDLEESKRLGDRIIFMHAGRQVQSPSMEVG